MNAILSVAAILPMSVSCTCSSSHKSGDGNGTGNIALQADTLLSYRGSGISFRVTASDSLLVIEPSGLSVTNEPVSHVIDGYSFAGAEAGDLDIDGYPEIFVYLVSDGSGSYGDVVGYSVNEGKSMSMIFIPEICGDIARGYMGHDEMAVVESSFCRRFPVYNDGDSNSAPSGGIRQIQYRIEKGEAGKMLAEDKVLEF